MRQKHRSGYQVHRRAQPVYAVVTRIASPYPRRYDGTLTVYTWRNLQQRLPPWASTILSQSKAAASDLHNMEAFKVVLLRKLVLETIAWASSEHPCHTFPYRPSIIKKKFYILNNLETMFQLGSPGAADVQGPWTPSPLVLVWSIVIY